MKGNEKTEPLTKRRLLLRLAKLHGGDWEKIQKSIYDHDTAALTVADPTPTELNGWTPITILDPEYPKVLSEGGCVRPPFVILYKGDLSILEKDLVLLYGATREETGHVAVNAFIEDLAKEGLPAMVLCQSSGLKSQGRVAAMEFSVIRRERDGKKEFAVWIANSVTDPDEVADEAVAHGGLALRTSWPGSTPRPDPLGASAPIHLCKAALVLGGSVRGTGTITTAMAAGAGKPLGVLAREVGDRDATLNLALLSDGAAHGGILCVSSTDDAWKLLRDDQSPDGVDEEDE